jgi:hypothetical protein
MEIIIKASDDEMNKMGFNGSVDIIEHIVETLDNGDVPLVGYTVALNPEEEKKMKDIMVIGEIRRAIGDEGKMMQSELVAHIVGMHELLKKSMNALDHDTIDEIVNLTQEIKTFLST